MVLRKALFLGAIVVVCLAGVALFLSFISEGVDTGMISKEDLFPVPSEFGTDCKVAGIRQPLLRPHERGEIYEAQRIYEKPRMFVRVTRYPDPEFCSTMYDRLREDRDKRRKLEFLESRGVPGYLFGNRSHPICTFRFGNVLVQLSDYSPKLLDDHLRSLLDHFEAVVD